MDFRKLINIIEGAAGYIAKNSKEAKDPRFSMSMTQDIKPGEIERQAKKFGNEFPPPLLHSKAAKNSTPNKLINLGLTESIVDEARGVTARLPGERYVNDKDPNDFRIIQSIDVISPPDAPAYKTVDDLAAAIKAMLPAKAKVINDNKAGSDMRAAIVAKVSTPSNDIEYWVRYIKAVPPAGVHQLWQTLHGFSYDNPRSASEKIAIKPSDLIKDERPRSLKQLSADIKAGVAALGDNELTNAMNQAIDQASQGNSIRIKNGVKYATAISKYAGEYLGAMTLMTGKEISGDLKKAMDALNIATLKNSKIVFPQARLQELYDSTLITTDGQNLQISTKMHKTGSGSSLSGVVKQLNSNIESQYPHGSKILRMLGGEASGEIGLLKASQEYKIISADDINEVQKMDKGSKDPNIIKSPTLKSLFNKQRTRAGASARPGYTIRRHLMAAIANNTIQVINQDQEVLKALMLALNNNNYLQVVTRTTITGNDVLMDFYTKYPTEFTGNPQLQNSAFWSTGEQGRITFGLPSNINVPVPTVEPEEEPVNITAREPRGKTTPVKKDIGRKKRK